jgi:hypothetical protein
MGYLTLYWMDKFFQPQDQKSNGVFSDVPWVRESTRRDSFMFNNNCLVRWTNNVYPILPVQLNKTLEFVQVQHINENDQQINFVMLMINQFV